MHFHEILYLSGQTLSMISQTKSLALFFWPKILFFFVFLFSFFNGFGQIESDKNQFPEFSELSKNEQIDTLMVLAKNMLRSTPVSSIIYCSEALSLVKQDNTLKTAEILLLQGDAYSKLGDQDEALKGLIKAEEILIDKKEFKLLIQAQVLFAQAYFDLGNLKKAKSSVAKGFKLIEDKGFTPLNADLHIVSASILLLEGDFDSALLLCEKAQAILKETPRPSLSVKLEFSLSIIWRSKGSPQKKDEYMRSALNMAVENSYRILEGECLSAITESKTSAGNFKEAQGYLEKSYAIAKESQSYNLLINVKEQDAQLQSLQGNLQEAICLYEETLEIGKKIKAAWAVGNTLIALGRTYGEAQQLKKAIELTQQAVKHSEDNEFVVQQIRSYYGLGGIYIKNHYPEEGKKYLRKCAELAKKTGSPVLLTYGYWARVAIALYDKDYGLAADNMKKAYELSKDGSLEENRLANMANIAMHYYFAKDRLQSLEWLEKTLANKEALENQKLLSITVYNYAGQIYRTYDREKGIYYLKKVLEINKEVKKEGEDDRALYFLARAYEQQENYKEALHYEKRLRNLQDSIAKTKLEQEIVSLTAEFETERKDKEIISFKKDKEFQELQLDNQKKELAQRRLYFLILFLFTITIVVVGFLLFNRYKLKRQSEKLELERKNKEADQKFELEILKTKFFADVSHELRTPLTLIKGPIEQMISNPEMAGNTSQLDLIQRNTDRLIELVNQTLDLSKIENGHMAFHPRRTKFYDLAKDVCNSFLNLSEKRNIAIHLIDQSESITADIDVSKMEKVLMNLISNAFQHTLDGGEITLLIEPSEIRKTSIKASALQVSVSDSGKGINPEHLEHLFDRFYQVNTLEGKGSGIGLTLSKEIIEMHSGSIKVESTIEVGTTFIFTIPIKQEKQYSETETTPVSPSTFPSTILPHIENVTDLITPEKKVVLVVDDNPDMVQHLTEILSPLYNIITASNGNEALKQAKNNHIDLIVSDVMMPGQDGYEITHILKTQFATSHIPIVLLTAKASHDSKLIGLDTGADDYLTKPFHAPELLSRINNLILQRKQLRKLFTNNSISSDPLPSNHQKVDEAFLEKVQSITETNLSKPEFTVEKFCTDLALNRTSVHLKLKALTGMSASQYIKFIRLKKAAELIKEGNESMTNIAEMVGFNSRQTFNKSFKEQFNMTPSEFAKI